MELSSDNIRESLLFRNIDANVDPFSIDIEKQLQRLPSNIKYIKKYLYFEFLPKVFRKIHDLETIKESSNYDNTIQTIKPSSAVQTGNISCYDLFDNHNLKYFSSNKILLGTLSGMMTLYDIETDKLIFEKTVSKRSRVEIISTATVRYYDSYLSRIAVCIRGDPCIQIFSYNHSFSVMNLECIVNLAGIDIQNSHAPINLANLPCEVKLSKCGFYMAVTDYLGGVRVYRFNDIPQAQSQIVPSNNANISIPNVQKQSSLKDPTTSQSKNSTAVGETVINTNALQPVFITHITGREILENVTILDIKEKNKNALEKEKEKSVTIAKQQSNPVKSIKPQQNTNQTLEKKDTTLLLNEANYSLKTIYDEKTNQDLTSLRKFDKHHPFISFVQKKLIFEEKYNQGFTSCLVTVGIYVSFYNTNNFRHIALYPYLTENMKIVHKIPKARSGVLSADDMILHHASLPKKEKDFLSFIKLKLEAPSVSSVMNTNNARSSMKDNQSKSEMNFLTLYPITYMNGQRQYSNSHNLLGVGLKQGTVIVWNCELHTELFFLPETRCEIISLCIDENYLTCGSLDGQIHIYELVYGNQIYSCYHNPYINNPVASILPFFPFMLSISDTQDKTCIYNAKDKQKIAKLNFEEINDDQIYQINYFNRFMIGCTEDYLIFICRRENGKKKMLSLIDLINFQNKKEKSIVEEYNTSEYINCFQNKFSECEIPTGNRYIVAFKIRDILLKCYPDLVYSYQKGYSLRKIVRKYKANDFPLYSTVQDYVSSPTNPKEGSVNTKPEKAKLKLRPIPETKKVGNRLTRSHDVQNLRYFQQEDKKEEPAKEVNAAETYGLLSKNLSILNPTAPNNTLRKSETDYYSTKKKDILYFSFKSLRERYQYRDQRSTRIQQQNEIILKSLVKLPLIVKRK